MVAKEVSLIVKTKTTFEYDIMSEKYIIYRPFLWMQEC